LKKLILALLGVILFGAWGTSIVNAQGFAALLEKIDNLEARIANLEKAGGGELDLTSYEEQFAKLESQLADLPRTLPDISGLEARLAGLEQAKPESEIDPRLEFIENSIIELSMKVKAMEDGQVSASATGQSSDTDSQLAASVRELTSELKNAFTHSEEAPSPIESGEESQDDESLSLGNIELAGFFDLVYLMPDNNEDEQGFALNQMEIDIESAFSPFITIAGAIAYGGEAFEVGAAYADLHWMGESVSHPVHSTTFEHSGLMIGQFDVPFGADFERIASPDRSLFSAPLAVSETVDGWNDLGLNLYGGHDLWDAQMYFVNGDQENMAYGGRLTFSLSEYLRVGGSSASILNSEDKPQANFFGGDIVLSYDPIEVTAEYILKQDELQADKVDIAGYYAEGKLGLGTWLKKDIYVVGGYSAVEHKTVEVPQVNTRLNRATFGAGFNINDNASMRFEYLINGGDDIEDANLAIGQFVVSF